MKIKNSLLHTNKKGQTIDLATGTIVALVVATFVIFAVLFGVSALNPTSFFPRGATALQNLSNDAVQSLQDNTTRVVSNFSQQLPVLGTILGVVLLLGALGILILIIYRFKDTAGSSGGL